MKRAISLFVAVALAAGLLTLPLGPAEAAFPGGNGKIAFQSNRDTTSGEIYTIVPGEMAKRITVSNGSSDPAYSPDGSRIAFVSTGNQIFVMNSDGTGRRQVTTGTTAKIQPTWSPDGSRIAYVSNSVDVDGQTDLEIWAINADGSGHTQLTNNTFPDTQPAWSPLGDRIAFVSARTGETDRNVYVMDADGSDQTNITPSSPAGCSPTCYQGHDDGPSWSPDGNKIAYVHGYGPPTNPFAGGGQPNIWTMDPDGGAKVNVSNTNSRSDTQPAWSPDGMKITMVGATDTNRDIYMMDANGANPETVEVGGNAAHDTSPDWQPVPVCTNTNATSGNDVITGTAGRDVLCGGDGNDTINGGGGNDIILGEAGNDRLVGGAENDILNGGSGADTALYTGTLPVTANLTTQFATGVGSDTLPGIERLTGSSAGDELRGSLAANVLVGGDGADEILGLGGNDKLNSRDGRKNDTVNGGPGKDKCTTDNREVSITSCE